MIVAARYNRWFIPAVPLLRRESNKNGARERHVWGRWELNPQGISIPEDFKSPASASSATAPYGKTARVNFMQNGGMVKG
jgi:hypothetical protein